MDGGELTLKSMSIVTTEVTKSWRQPTPDFRFAWIRTCMRTRTVASWGRETSALYFAQRFLFATSGFTDLKKPEWNTFQHVLSYHPSASSNWLSETHPVSLFGCSLADLKKEYFSTIRSSLYLYSGTFSSVWDLSSFSHVLLLLHIHSCWNPCHP